MKSSNKETSVDKIFYWPKSIHQRYIKNRKNENWNFIGLTFFRAAMRKPISDVFVDQSFFHFLGYFTYTFLFIYFSAILYFLFLRKIFLASFSHFRYKSISKLDANIFSKIKLVVKS